MAILAMFKVGTLSPYVEDNFEDPSNLRTNPLEEGDVNVEQDTIESSHNLNHDQGTN